MRVFVISGIPPGAVEPTAIGRDGDWPAAFVTLAILLGAVLLLALLGAFALAAGHGARGRAERSRRPTRARRRWPDVVVLDLDDFSDAELARLARLRRKYRRRRPASARERDRAPRPVP